MSQNTLLHLLLLLFLDIFSVGATLRSVVQIQVLEHLPQTFGRGGVMVSVPQNLHVTTRITTATRNSVWWYGTFFVHSGHVSTGIRTGWSAIVSAVKIFLRSSGQFPADHPKQSDAFQFTSWRWCSRRGVPGTVTGFGHSKYQHYESWKLAKVSGKTYQWTQKKLVSLTGKRSVSRPLFITGKVRAHGKALPRDRGVWGVNEVMFTLFVIGHEI